MHQILTALNGTPDQWLVDLLFAFNRGDLDKFDAYKKFWSQQVCQNFEKEKNNLCFIF